jgi:hypothetical protein
MKANVSDDGFWVARYLTARHKIRRLEGMEFGVPPGEPAPCLDRITLLQLHMFCTLPGDYAFNRVLADLNHDMDHYVTQGNLCDPTLELIPC